jgi:hypothetical protein
MRSSKNLLKDTGLPLQSQYNFARLPACLLSATTWVRMQALSQHPVCLQRICSTAFQNEGGEHAELHRKEIDELEHVELVGTLTAV